MFSSGEMRADRVVREKKRGRVGGPAVRLPLESAGCAAAYLATACFDVIYVIASGAVDWVAYLQTRTQRSGDRCRDPVLTITRACKRT